MSGCDWDELLERLACELRSDPGGAEGERMIWAFEQALNVARIDEGLLSHLLAATTCLLARIEDSTPRDVLEAFFRRAVSEEVWRHRYLPLFE
jgi:hypothetical protein